MLKSQLANIKLKNPLILASGIFGLSQESMERCEDAGAVVTKSIGADEETGYTNPVFYDLEYGILNAIGLANPGINDYLYEVKDIKIQNVIGSIFGRNHEEFGDIAHKFAPYIKAIEMNLSCPHARLLGAEYPTSEIGRSVELTREAGKPVFVKLGMENIVERAEKAIDGGADALVAINSIKAMAINIDTGLPVLGNKIGGYSGKAIKPIGVRCVYDLASCFDIPIIGVGGILKAEDVIEYMMSGASAVQIGSALYYHKEKIFTEICNNLEVWLNSNGYNNINDIIGLSLTK